MTSVPWSEVGEIAWLTLRVTLLATLAGALVGVPLGSAIGLRAKPTAALFRILVYTLYSLPPILAGLLVFMLLSRAGPLGGLRLLFTPTALVIVEALLAAPIIAGLTIAALAEVPPNVREAVRASGAGSWLRHWTLIEEARFGILAGVMVGFGRALAEVAGALLVGGNARHETRTLGTAILQQTAQGDFAFALALGAILLGLALATVLVLARLQRANAEGRA